MKKLLLLILVALPAGLFAQELVYKPINPSFIGGNSFNAQWLMGSADSQNRLKEEDQSGRGDQSELDRFTESLNRQLLNSLSRDLFQGQFGDESFTEGTFTFGSLVIDIVPSSTGLSINILDTNTGEQTQIIIPN